MKLIKKIKETKGFTLIELVVVIAILAILALVLIPTITGQVDKATASKNQANARSIYSAAMLLDSEKPVESNEPVPGPWLIDLRKITGTNSGDDLGVTKVDGKFTITYEGVSYP